jgi:putative ABC transport system permease protein
MDVDKDFFQVMGIEIVEGRDFSKRLITDVGDSFIVNQKMVKKMGWEQALGKHVGGTGRVIGVAKDFHHGSFHIPIDALVFRRLPDKANVTGQNRDLLINYLTVNIADEGIFETLDFLEDKMAEFDPKHPFEFEFLDDFLNKLYQDEQRLMSLTGIFAAVCIFISCMGLFGLAAFTTEQRTKEIGIRKVLGASVGQIITMLAQNIMLLVILSAVIASGIAYWAMYEWLSEFEYHIKMNMDSWVFLVSAAVAAAVAYVTITLQSLKTAQANPINALRYE